MYIHIYERAPAIKRRVVPGRVALALLTVLVVSTDVYWIVAYARDVIVAPVYKGLGVTSRARGVDAICTSGTTTIARFRRVASPRSGTDDITNRTKDTSLFHAAFVHCWLYKLQHLSI